MVDARYNDSIKTYAEFKELFKKRYDGERVTPKHREMFWKLYLEGPKYHDIVSYICKLKVHAEDSSERFTSTLDKLCELTKTLKYNVM